MPVGSVWLWQDCLLMYSIVLLLCWTGVGHLSIEAFWYLDWLGLGVGMEAFGRSLASQDLTSSKLTSSKIP